jgi:hypothetical protein
MRFSANQEIPRILWNLKVHNRIHKSPPPALILSKIDPAHAPNPTSRKSILILFYRVCLGLTGVSFSQVSPNQNSVEFI